MQMDQFDIDPCSGVDYIHVHAHVCSPSLSPFLYPLSPPAKVCLTFITTCQCEESYLKDDSSCLESRTDLVTVYSTESLI